MATTGLRNLTCTSVMVSVLSRNTKANAGQLPLDLLSATPPPTQDIDHVAVRGKQTCVGRRVMAIPCVRLALLNLTDSGIVTWLSEDGRTRDTGGEDDQSQHNLHSIHWNPPEQLACQD